MLSRHCYKTVPGVRPYPSIVIKLSPESGIIEASLYNCSWNQGYAWHHYITVPSQALSKHSYITVPGVRPYTSIVIKLSPELGIIEASLYNCPQSQALFRHHYITVPKIRRYAWHCYITVHWVRPYPGIIIYNCPHSQALPMHRHIGITFCMLSQAVFKILLLSCTEDLSDLELLLETVQKNRHMYGFIGILPQ